LQPKDNGSNIATQSIHQVEFQLAFAFFLLALKTKYHAFMLTLISILTLSGKAEVEDLAESRKQKTRSGLLSGARI
jgi:hypothetical protein